MKEHEKLNNEFLIFYILQICQNKKFLNDERVTISLLGGASRGNRKDLSEFFRIYSEYVDIQQETTEKNIKPKIEFINNLLSSSSKRETIIALSEKPEDYFEI